MKPDYNVIPNPLHSYETGFRKIIITLTVIVSAMLELIDTTIVNVALTQISGNLGASIDDVAWVVTSYAIANVIVIPLSGFLGNLLGRRNYYIGSILLFTFASLLCGMAPNIWSFSAFCRVSEAARSFRPPRRFSTKPTVPKNAARQPASFPWDLCSALP